MGDQHEGVPDHDPIPAQGNQDQRSLDSPEGLNSRNDDEGTVSDIESLRVHGRNILAISVCDVKFCYTVGARDWES